MLGVRVVRVFCSNRIKTNIMNIKYKNLRKRVFIIFVIFSLLYAELIITYTSPIGPMNSLAIFVDEKGNEIENAIGYFTITDRVHFLIKGQGRYRFKVLFDLFDSISLKRNVAEIIYKYEIIMSHFIKQAYEIKKKIDSEKDKVVKEKLKEQYISLLKQSESWISDLKDLLLSKTEYVKNKPEVNLLIQLTRIYLLGEKTARQFTKGLQKALEFKIFGIFSVYFVTAFAITLLQHDSKLYLSITTDKTFLESFGILLTILNLVIFNCDLDHLDSIFNGDKKPETLIITNNNNEEVETSDKLYKIEQGLQFLGIFLVSLGMFLKSFGAPFYMSLELVHKIGEIIRQHLGEQAEYVWNTVAGFEIPLIGQTVFEFVVNLALGGWMLLLTT